MIPDLVVAAGTVVLPGGAVPADVEITGERISGLRAAGGGEGRARLDARGLIVLPGGVDPHVHFLVSFMGQRSVYDFASGGIAALRGGTTTVIDFALQRRGGAMLAGLAHRRRQADPGVTVDYGLHLIVTDVNPASLGELASLRAAGVSSLKVYTTYEEDGLRLDDGALHALMARSAAEGMQIVLHAENDAIIARLRREAVAAGHRAPRFHALTRPPVTEIEAIGRAIAFARDTGCALHILHLAAAGALPLVAAARREGLRVTAETCTHYLALTDEALAGPDGSHFVMSPPLRPAANRDLLWQGLRAGPLTAVTSDEVSYPAAAKTPGAGTFADIANGCPGVEARLPVLYTLGVAAGRIGLERLAQVFATWPAQMFGLGGRKGRIAPGMDADLVVIDPAARRVMTAACHYGPIGYTPFAGMELCGWPVATVARGAVVVREGEFLGAAGRGRFLARGPADACAEDR